MTHIRQINKVKIETERKGLMRFAIDFFCK